MNAPNPQTTRAAGNGTAVAQRQPDAFATIAGLLERNKSQFERVLPKHMDADRLVRIALTQIRLNPKLGECTPQSMVAACMKAAQLGLEPDGVTGRAYLIPRKNGRLSRQSGRDVYEVNFQRGYKGVLDLCYRSGLVTSVRAEVVRDGDFLKYEKGTADTLVHREGTDNWNAKITHVYAVVKTKDGGVLWDCWPAEKVEEHRRRFSKDTRDDSVWETDWDSMAKKTVLLAVMNLAPQSVESARAFGEETAPEMIQDAAMTVLDAPTVPLATSPRTLDDVADELETKREGAGSGPAGTIASEKPPRDGGRAAEGPDPGSDPEPRDEIMAELTREEAGLEVDQIERAYAAAGVSSTIEDHSALSLDKIRELIASLRRVRAESPAPAADAQTQPGAAAAPSGPKDPDKMTTIERLNELSSARSNSNDRWASAAKKVGAPHGPRASSASWTPEQQVAVIRELRAMK